MDGVNANNPKRRKVCHTCDNKLLDMADKADQKQRKGVARVASKMCEHAKERVSAKKVSAAKYRNKYVVNITSDDVIAIWPRDGKCPVFGIPFTLGGGVANKDWGPQLDRIDNERGYEPDNIQIISGLANKMKTSATDAQMIEFSLWVLRGFTANNGKED